jgi:hypothetical protein
MSTTGRPPSLGEYSGQVQLEFWRGEAEESDLDRSFFSSQRGCIITCTFRRPWRK